MPDQYRAGSIKAKPDVEATAASMRDDSEQIEISIDGGTALHRGLKSRHTAMIGELLLGVCRRYR